MVLTVLLMGAIVTFGFLTQGITLRMFWREVHPSGPVLDCLLALAALSTIFVSTRPPAWPAHACAPAPGHRPA